MVLGYMHQCMSAFENKLALFLNKAGASPVRQRVSFDNISTNQLDVVVVLARENRSTSVPRK